MEKRLILRGVAAGGIAGVLCFIFTRIFAEPVIQAAINYQTARDAAQAALDKAAGVPGPPPGPDIFSRTIQADIGAGVGLIFFGAAVGALFAVAYILIGRKVRMNPRVLALLVAGGGFLGMYMVPFLKYPANPPSIGNPATIRDRGLLYLTMVVISVAGLVLAGMAARWLRNRLGVWNAVIVAGVAYAVIVGAAMAILPPLGHLHANVIAYGRHMTETPLPLRNPQGRIVFPGFPADVLFNFRLYSIINQLILWSGIGLIFGFLADRLLAEQSRSNQPLVTPTLY
jgi:hypothetical protein